ncbi:hypothetical protein EJ08DRAFT_736779 [Tothia fuscella]|uniref:Uncharacterized protein n=1 Tax=Tothia fuscella TaxID=1048955 RepID=A0A9P4NKL0_9PEZI|nr:hypothetical protein EJ08DRAFT_736779 [Tothia fuscella]
MSSSCPIPVLSYGRHASTAAGVKEGLAPEYDVVHFCLTEDAAKAEFPRVLSGDLDGEPACDIGSNAGRKVEDRLVPKTVLCGGGISLEEVDELKSLVGDKPGLVWIKLNPEDLDGPPGPATIVPFMKRKLQAAGL